MIFVINIFRRHFRPEPSDVARVSEERVHPGGRACGAKLAERSPKRALNTRSPEE